MRSTRRGWLPAVVKKKAKLKRKPAIVRKGR